MDRVELQQKRMLLGIALRVVQQDDLATRASVDQIAKDKFSNPAKAVQGYAGHDNQAFACASVPMASTRDCNDMRFSDAKGSSTKAMIRRRSAA